MTTSLEMLRHALLTISALYALNITIATIVAVITTHDGRRRAALTVLHLLLVRPQRNQATPAQMRRERRRPTPDA